ncbi:MAG: 50S ribosomal protein L17 [Candidatus Saccharimonadales bacterium]|jgi:large subunit ribosomal protein L17
MHRHGYQGRKLHRDEAQRKALLRGFAISLIEHGAIETTLPRAKELVPFIEPIITKAKRGDLASRRAVLSALDNQIAMTTLVDQLAPQMSGRVSGHVRITRTRFRVGDNAQLARVSFVDELSRDVDAKKPAAKKPAAKPAAKKPATTKPAAVKAAPSAAAKPARSPRKVVAADSHMSHKPTVSVRKSGDR